MSDLVRPLGDGPLDRWDDPVRGTVTFRTIFSRGVSPTAGLTAGILEIEPGDRFAAHRHPQTEVYLVLQGEGMVRIGGDEVFVAAGEAVCFPSGESHEVRNTSATGVLRVFYVLDADALDDVNYEWGRPDKDD